MTSINTNNGAMVALQTLKSINNDMGKVQSEISTGLKVATAKDNSSCVGHRFHDEVGRRRAQQACRRPDLRPGDGRRGRVGHRAERGYPSPIQEKVVQAENPDADTGKLKTEIDALADTIASIGTSAQYNGINLVDATNGSVTQKITVSITRDSSVAGVVSSEQIDSGVADLVDVAAKVKAIAFTDATTTQAALDTIDAELDIVNTAAAGFGAVQARIEAQGDFVSKQAASLKSGVGALVDANMEEASARLQALQVQQQLGTQSLSIANQAPQSVLSLFR